MRLDKFLTETGIGTRSQVKTIIKNGRVSINGVIKKKPEDKVTIENQVLIDEVFCDKIKLTYSKYQYYMLNKPAGVVSATDDNINETVIDLIADSQKDLFPVGRLDKDTEGLLLITNDGDLAHRLLSPKKHVPKTYYAVIDGPIEEKHVQKFAAGVYIHDRSKDEEMVKLKPSQLEIIRSSDSNTEVHITIEEGKYHQIKRMFAAIHRNVIYLKRISMGPITIDDTLELGEYRRLTEDELTRLGEQND